MNHFLFLVVSCCIILLGIFGYKVWSTYHENLNTQRRKLVEISNALALEDRTTWRKKQQICFETKSQGKTNGQKKACKKQKKGNTIPKWPWFHHIEYYTLPEEISAHEQWGFALQSAQKMAEAYTSYRQQNTAGIPAYLQPLLLAFTTPPEHALANPVNPESKYYLQAGISLPLSTPSVADMFTLLRYPQRILANPTVKNLYSEGCLRMCPDIPRLVSLVVEKLLVSGGKWIIREWSLGAGYNDSNPNHKICRELIEQQLGGFPIRTAEQQRQDLYLTGLEWRTEVLPHPLWERLKQETPSDKSTEIWRYVAIHDILNPLRIWQLNKP